MESHVEERESRNPETTELPDPTELAEGEFAKSKATRTRILEAAIHCLAVHGYAATSTNAVATEAGITRAALLYHFPSRAALIQAVIHYVTRRRVEMQEVWRDLPRDESYPARSMESLWEQLKTPEFWAFCELSTAARTSRSLGRVFKPAMEAFDRSRREMALQLAQEHIVSAPGFDLRRDITRFLLEGLAQQDGITFNQERRFGELMAFLKLLYMDNRFNPLLEKAVAMAGEPQAGGNGI